MIASFIARISARRRVVGGRIARALDRYGQMRGQAPNTPRTALALVPSGERSRLGITRCGATSLRTREARSTATRDTNAPLIMSKIMSRNLNP